MYRRRIECADAVRAEVAPALEVNTGLVNSSICGHLLITVVIDEMVRAAEAADMSAVLQLLEALVAAGLKPGRKDAMRVIKAFVDDGRPETVRIYRRVAEWVGRL